MAKKKVEKKPTRRLFLCRSRDKYELFSEKPRWYCPPKDAVVPDPYWIGSNSRLYIPFEVDEFEKRQPQLKLKPGQRVEVHVSFEINRIDEADVYTVSRLKQSEL